MINFISSKLTRGAKMETGSEDTSQAGEKGLGVTSNQSEFSESVMVAPSELPELNESADQIVFSQLQRENEDLKEVWLILVHCYSILVPAGCQISRGKLSG